MTRKANSLKIDVSVEVYATMNPKAALESLCPESKVALVSLSLSGRSKANVVTTICTLLFNNSSSFTSVYLGS